MQPMHPKAFTRWESISMLVIAVILCLLLIPKSKQTINDGRRERLRDQMKVIGLALFQYQEKHGCLPPAVLKDGEGRLTHSWRTLLLPHLEPHFKSSAHRYDYRFDEPWHSPHNEMIASANPDFYRMIITRDDETLRTSRLVAIIDDSTYWSPAEDRRSLMNHKKHEPRIILMEVPILDGLWNEPLDITLDELEEKIAVDVFAENGAHVLYDNGRRHWLSPEEVNVPNMRKLLQVEATADRKVDPSSD